MDPRQALLRRQQLDRQLVPLNDVAFAAPPSGGWIKSIREALGMSLQTFAHRLGLASRSAAHQLEQAEVEESITVKRLRAAANALGCDLAIVFVPRVPLAQAMEQRAREKARERLRRVGHSMAMEEQGVSGPPLDEMIEQAARDILQKGDSRLWD